MRKIKIGLAGLGTVGKGVYEILQKDAKLISQRTKHQLELVAVSSRSKKDFIDETKIKFYADAVDLARDPEIDVVIEVIGGNAVAKEIFETAIKNGKKIVTANKSLIAENGFELAELVEKYNSYIAFEAAVAAAIPIVKIFRESFSSSKIESFAAILNGSCNFILTKMQQENLTFDEAQKQAQDLGYLEADPSFDIKGIDTAHKLAILSAIACGSRPAFEQTHIEGIENISIEDINLAFELGYKIKLLAIYKNHGPSIEQAVYPALIKSSEKIAQVDDSFNAILTKASNADWNFICGRGAGSLETASAVVSDLIDIANDRHSFMFGVENKNLIDVKIENISQRFGQYFLKLIVNKSLAQKTDLSQKIFGEKIKIEKAIFFDANEEILCGFITQVLQESDLLEIMKNLDSNLVRSAKFLRVENSNPL
jgi:homoserine dehydrogenase